MQPPAPLVVGFDLDMTLIDTRPGFAATLAVLAAETGVELDVEEISGRLGPPLDLLLAPHYPARRSCRRPRRPVPRALPRARDRADPQPSPVRTRPWPPYDGTAAAASSSPGSTAPTPLLHLEALGAGRRRAGRRGLGRRQGAGADRARRDGLRRRPRARRRGRPRRRSGQRLGADRRLHASRSCATAGTDVVLRDLTELPGWLDAHLLDDAARRRWRSGSAPSGRCWWPTAAGADSAFLLAAAVRALGAEHVGAATAYSDSLPQSERSPAAGVRRGARGAGVHAGDARDGARGLPRQRRRPLLLLQGRAARRARAARRGARVRARSATGTNADDAVAGFRPGIRAAAERGRGHPAARRRPHQGPGARRLPAWDLPTWDKPAAACLSSRVAFGIEVSPFRLARVERAEAAARAALAAAGIDVRDLRVRDIGRPRQPRGRRRAGRRGAPRHRPCSPRCWTRGSTDAEVDPQGFRSGSMNERLAEPERFR